MRVMSQDRCTNVEFEGNMFCVFKDDESGKYMIAVRTPSFTHFFPLAEYETEKEAMDRFIELSNAYSSFDVETFYL